MFIDILASAQAEANFFFVFRSKRRSKGAKSGVSAQAEACGSMVLQNCVQFLGACRCSGGAIFLWFALSVMPLSCASHQPVPVTYSVQQVSDVDAGVLLDAAEATLIEEGFRIQWRDAERGIITTIPLEVPTPRPATSTDFQLSSRGFCRRVAEVCIERKNGVTRLLCQVVIEQRVTEAHRMFTRQYGDNNPSMETPIDRDAATTEEQNTVWKTIRRDRGTERRILNAVLETEN